MGHYRQTALFDVRCLIEYYECGLFPAINRKGLWSSVRSARRASIDEV